MDIVFNDLSGAPTMSYVLDALNAAVFGTVALSTNAVMAEGCCENDSPERQEQVKQELLVPPTMSRRPH
jgi:hypothetical protein